MFLLATSRIARVSRLALAVGLVAGLAGPVAASPPQEVEIRSHTVRDCPVDPVDPPCIFVATGAITDEGTVETRLVRATALPSPVVGTAQYVRTFTGAKGSFTIRLNSMITGTDDPWLFDEQGHWVIVSGTGDYAGLLGQGRESGTRDFANQSLDALYTGQVH